MSSGASWLHHCESLVLVYLLPTSPPSSSSSAFLWYTHNSPVAIRKPLPRGQQEFTAPLQLTGDWGLMTGQV